MRECFLLLSTFCLCYQVNLCLPSILVSYTGLGHGPGSSPLLIPAVKWWAWPLSEFNPTCRRVSSLSQALFSAGSLHVASLVLDIKRLYGWKSHCDYLTIGPENGPWSTIIPCLKLAFEVLLHNFFPLPNFINNLVFITDCVS